MTNHFKDIKRIRTFIIIAAILALANQSLSGQASVDGIVTKISDKKITIKTRMADSIPEGSRVDLFFEISEGQHIPTGQWKISGGGDGEVFAEPVDVVGPPKVGMIAKILFPENKESEQANTQNTGTRSEVSQPENPTNPNAIFDSIKPELRGKESIEHLRGVSFPKKSAEDYLKEGDTYFYEKNYKMAFKEYKHCARKGNAECQAMIGNIYHNGLAVETDFTKARIFYEEAARQNNVMAIYNLGVIYFKGQGVKQDRAKAFELYLKSANMGFPKAQFNIGALYYNGVGIKKDNAAAVRWFKKAADQDIPKAIFVVGQAYEFGWASPKNMSKAKEYYNKAADLGDKDAIKKLKSL